MDKSRNNPIIRMSHTACSAGRRRLRILAFWQAVRAWWIQRGSSEREKASISEEKASTTKSMSSSDIKNPGTEGCSRIVSYWQDRSSTLKRSALNLRVGLIRWSPPPCERYADRVFFFLKGIIMQNVTLIGIDLGKHSFHVHAQDKNGNALLRKKFSRNQLTAFLSTCAASTVVMESCAGAHFMARHISQLGHQVKLISPQFVRPFVKSNKNDFIDAEAICEAASRPSMRFVTPRTEDQQAMSALHRVRDALVRERVKTTNQMHAFLLEFGISMPRGIAVIRRLAAVLEEHELPPYLARLLMRLHQHYAYLTEQIEELEQELKTHMADDDTAQRLLTIPGVGLITASLLATKLGDGKSYASSRDFAASTGLVPRQYSTGGKSTLMGISKRGDKNLRRLLVQCARAFMQRLEHNQGRLADWVKAQLLRHHSNVVACGLANKLARIAWSVTTHRTAFIQ